MEKKRKSYNNDMYRYTSKGDTLYDFLGKYLDQYAYSPSTLFNALRRDLNIQQDIGASVNSAQYKGLVKLYRETIHGKVIDSMLQNISKKDERELLEKLQSVNPEKYSFPGVLQYIAFLEDCNFTHRATTDTVDESGKLVLDPEIDELNRILIDTATEKADSELVTTVRNSLVRGMLIPYVRRQINKEPDGPEKQEHYQKLKLLQNIFFNQESVQEYDDAIRYSREREEEAMLKARRAVDFKFKRLSAMATLTGKTMPELLERCDAQDGSFLDLITVPEEYKKYDFGSVPSQGSYHWSLVPVREPSLIMDEPIEFSNGGEENQRIIVARHGDFLYGKRAGLARFDESPLDLIGVTILGNDENLNYFVLTTSENARNMRTGKNVEYYKKVLLSPQVLDDIVARKYRYLPDISINEDGEMGLDYDKNFTMIDLDPQEVLKYATMYEGNIGRTGQQATIQEYCNSQALFERQIQLIHQLTRGIKSKNDDDRGEH